MTYKVSIQPDQTEAFQKLLRAWKFIGIVEDFQLDPGSMEDELLGREQAPEEETYEEMADAYRDLVD